ncbi:hypothetical protein PISMIDRAFT_22063 [Pisolithus microcarpus 441]|uniref:Uncharacterized protein n=1 Tax=Pisolithus microcarpus 441 TaxID=765257 RepID=A0A0C9YRZ9_9AGAM|nr:hypothetical protein PISMIDRAFT_22063 [Pisolithus microcarpus 441]
MRRVLQVPGPTAEVHELRKALVIAQKAYANMRTELCSICKELVALSSAIPMHKCNHVLNRTEMLDSSIATEAKKYVMLYCFWVTDSVFPMTFNPNVDPRSPSHWNLPEAKAKGMTAELYSVVLESLHESMEQNKCFGSVSIKDSASLIFTWYNLDSSMLSTQDICKQTDLKFRLLLMKNNEYTRLAPVLFKNHEALVPNEFLKSPIIVSARFLLLADPELGAVGAVTGIPYRDDFDFYCQHLFKHMTWAIAIMENINQEVFGTKSKPTNESLSVAESTPLSCTWEDNFLNKMESGTTALAPMPPANAMNTPQQHSPAPPTLPSPLSDDTAAHAFTSVSSTQGNSVTMSAVSQLQVEVSQLSPEPAKQNTRSHSTKSKVKK